MADDQEAETSEAPAAPAAAAEATTILPAQSWQTAALEPDPDLTRDDGDSGLGYDAASVSSTASISESILAYRTIHGRTYHSERGNAQYWGSNDQRANESIDLNHHMLTLCLGHKLYLAPLEESKLKKALDIGTGTGIWAIDFADAHPACTVLGTDISPIQPAWVPPNLSFQIDDCTLPWTFPSSSFDFIHLRYLVGSIVSWPALLSEAFSACAPGGWVESVEGAPWLESADGSIPPDSPMGQWGHFFVSGGKNIGRSFTVVDDGEQRRAMEMAGFVDIREKDIKCPVGAWPRDKQQKELGMYAQAVMMNDPEGYVLFMSAVVGGWSKEEVGVYLAQLRRQMNGGRAHAYFRVKVVWGRKPEG